MGDTKRRSRPDPADGRQDSRKGQVDDRHNKQKVFWRTVALMGLFGVLAFAPLVGKLYELQIVQHEELQEKAAHQQVRDLEVSAARGTVYDSEGNILAMSATVQDLVLSPKDLAAAIKANDEKIAAGKSANPSLNQAFIAQGLSQITGVDQEKILERMAKTDSMYEVLCRKMENETSEQVRAFIKDNKLGNGIYLEPNSKRYYPYASLASHIMGFTGSENQGLYGVEYVYDDALSGTVGRVVTAKNGAGTEMLSPYENYIDAQNGLDHHLTINATIQGFAEKALTEGIEKYEVTNGGFCIVMDPNTGGILAMASSPGYDPNSPFEIFDPQEAFRLEEIKADPAVGEDAYKEELGKAQWNQWTNRCVNDTYEPGSTFKSIVVAAALEEGVVSLDTQFYCNGSKQVADHTIHCAKRQGHGAQNLTDAVRNSCNPAFIEIGQKLGAEKFYDYMEDFGLLTYTGVDLNGENKGVVWDRKFFESKEGISSLATASFGQTFRITPMQLITAACAVVNGGHLMTPHVLDYTTDSAGNVVDTYPANEVRQVISEDTSATVRGMLEQVVGAKQGTGKNAYQAGYRIGGKTGTSEKIGADQNEDDYIVSFLGVAPANDPKVVVLLAYDTPKPSYPGSSWTAGGVYISGGNMAAPMAGPLIRQILDHLGVEKQYSAEELSGADATVPPLVGYTPDVAISECKRLGFTYRTIGEGEKVTGQIPAAGAVIPGGSELLIYLGESKPTDPVEVPNLTGKGPDETRQALAALNLYMRGSGSAQYFTSATLCAGQSIAPGTMVDPGTVIDVTFAENVTDFAQNN